MIDELSIEGVSNLVAKRRVQGQAKAIGKSYRSLEVQIFGWPTHLDGATSVVRVGSLIAGNGVSRALATRLFDDPKIWRRRRKRLSSAADEGRLQGLWAPANDAGLGGSAPQRVSTTLSRTASRYRIKHPLDLAVEI